MMVSFFARLLKSSFLKYGVVGVFGLVVDMGIFYLLHKMLGVNYVVSNIISSSLAVVHNFIMNSFITFKVKDRLLRRFASFYLIALAGMAVSSGMLAVMIDGLSMDSMVAKMISILIVAVIQYFFNKKLTFRKKRISQ
ncbi:MAG: GtrA family protein [Bacteroidales bacterium]|nr:GtrA family protein [Bacteroidales bacterium]MDD4713764.1 GtrA family protein [Bacteroidales bacterium]